MEKPPLSSEQNRSAEPADLSGVTISGQANVTARDIIGRDKVIHGDKYIGYTAAQVTVLLDKIRTEYQIKPFDGRSPYVGLASFQERDADKFFGRETLTAELVTRVAASAASNARALFVAGPSGSGKSSLVRAGLVPALRRGAPLWSPVLGSEHWLYETLKPGRKPLEELGRVAASFTGKLDARHDVETRGLTDATILHQWADIALNDDATRRVVLVIDQFEEIFTQLNTERENERVAFLNLLTHAATIENGRVLVIFTLRSDFVSNCASYPNLNALVNQQFIQVGAMTPDELMSAIARPAYQVGLRIDPALISQVVNDVRGEPGALPLMQFALQDLFQAEKAKGELTLDGYLARGGLHQALERHADAEFAKLDDAKKQLARSVFGGLVEIGRGREDTKRTALFDELVPAGADESRVQALVRELADARLITTDEQDGKETVTLAHERLIDAWAWLQRLVIENRDAIALQNEIAQDAQEWEQQKRDESYLYRGARLATAQEKLQQNKLVLSGLAQEFVETAIKAREEAKRKEARQTRRLIIAFGAAAAVFAVLAIVAFLAQQSAVRSEVKAQAESTRALEQQQTAEAERANAEQAKEDAESAADAADTAAREAGRQKNLAKNAEATAVAEAKIARANELTARAQELTARSITVLNDDSGLSLLLALESLELEKSFQGEDALRRALLGAPLWDTKTSKYYPYTDAVFSPDAKQFVTASDLNTVAYDPQTGKEIKSYDTPAISVSFSREGKEVVTASRDGTARTWDAKSGEPNQVLDGHRGIVMSAVFNSSGDKIVTAGQDGTARVWNAKTGEQIQKFDHPPSVISAAFSPDGNQIVTAGEDGTARVWNAETGEQIQKFDHPRFVLSAAFSPDGNQIVTAGSDQTARIWDAKTGKELNVLEGHLGAVSSAFYSGNGEQIVTAGYADGTIRIWDVRTGKEVKVLRGHQGGVAKARFSPDGQFVISVGLDKTVRLWALFDKELALLQEYPVPPKGNDAVISADFRPPDGEQVATAGADGIVRIWETQTGIEIKRFEQKKGSEQGKAINSVSYRPPDGKQLVTASDDGFGAVWDVETGQLRFRLSGHKGKVRSARYSPDGKFIVTASFDHTARIWDAQTGKYIRELQGHKGGIHYAGYDRDGTRIVTAGGCDEQEPMTCDYSVRIWDAASGKELDSWKAHTDQIWTASFSADGKIITASDDGGAIVWDPNTQSKLMSLRGHLAEIESANYSPDGKRIVTAGADKTARIWDAASGDELAVLRGSSREVLWATFSPNGKYIITTSTDGTARVYLVDIEDLIKLAKNAVSPRKFTCEEEKKFLDEKIVCPTPTPATSPTQ